MLALVCPMSLLNHTYNYRSTWESVETMARFTRISSHRLVIWMRGSHPGFTGGEMKHREITSCGGEEEEAEGRITIE